MTTILGTTLSGRYRLEARIGAGGMSTVYRALDETLQRQVAVKLMNREVASDSDQLERFRREARAVAQLSHPHIVGVIDAGEDDNRPYIVFEYVEGETLKERIRRLGRLPIGEAVAYAIEIARALGAAHARHIVHRDVKPQNVLIDQEGSAKVTDFGIARTLDEEGLTADGRVLGTTDYVSPEQALGQPVTGQSDLYSLGVVLYEMLTGEVPFKGENQVAVAMKHVREQIPDVQSKRPEVSAALAAVVETATAKRQEDRYANDAELIADLEDVLAIETARAGSATGEVTTVLRTLPSRHPAAGAAGDPPPGPDGDPGARWCSRSSPAWRCGWRRATHHGTGPPRTHRPERGPGAGNGASGAHGFNPLGNPTDEHPDAGLAIDNDPNTAWTTQHYTGGNLGKAGTGIYLDASPGVAARQLTIRTATPGWSATIYARNDAARPPRLAGIRAGSRSAQVGPVTGTRDDPAQHRRAAVRLLPGVDHQPRQARRCRSTSSPSTAEAGHRLRS